MSIGHQVREYFRGNLGVKVNNARLRELLETDDSQGISVALNQMFTNKEISREPIVQKGGGYQYWMGAAAKAAVIQPRVIKGSATADDDVLPPDSRPAVAEIEAFNRDDTKSMKAALSREKNGGDIFTPPQPQAAKKARKTYTKRTPPQSLPAPIPAPRAVVAPAAMFYVSDEGLIGIAFEGRAVHLTADQVRRLQDFLKTVAPLWN